MNMVMVMIQVYNMTTEKGGAGIFLFQKSALLDVVLSTLSLSPPALAGVQYHLYQSMMVRKEERGCVLEFRKGIICSLSFLGSSLSAKVNSS